MQSDGWTTFSSVIGTVGGAAGLLALARQERDRLRRRVLPGESRAVLLDALSIVSLVAREPQELPWVTEHVVPLTEQVKRLEEAAKARASGPWGRMQAARLGLLYSGLMTIRSYAISAELPLSPGQQLARIQDQRNAGQQALEVCRELLNRMP